MRHDVPGYVGRAPNLMTYDAWRHPAQGLDRELDEKVVSWQGIEVLHGWVLDYAAAHSCRLPDSLAEAQPADPVLVSSVDMAEFYRDMWGAMYLYNKQGDSFEIRSSGPDGTVSSSDDLIYIWRPESGPSCTPREERMERIPGFVRLCG